MLCALMLAIICGAGPCIAQQPTAQQQSRWFELSADESLRYEPDARTMTASGNVRAVYGEFEVQAQRMSGDLQARSARFPGPVVLIWRGERFEGQDLDVNLDTQEWVLRAVRGSLSPGFFQQGVVRPVIIGAVAAEGSPAAIKAGSSYATTCDLVHPHYRLQAREIRIRPGRDLVARRVSFLLGEQRILSLPSFWVSLKERTRQTFFPEVGESELEGAYLKTRTAYSLSPTSYGAVLLDAMSNRGLGQGVEHFYAAGAGLVNVRIYHVINPHTGLRELSGNLSHEQALGRQANFSLRADAVRNAAWYLGASTVASVRSALDFRDGATSSGLSFGYNTSGSGAAARFAHWDAALRHDRPGLSLAAEYQRDTAAPGESDDQELNARLTLARSLRLADLTLDASRRFDVDGSQYAGDDFYYVKDRLPELALNTTAARLGIKSLRALPSRLNLSVGNFHEMPTDLTAYRANFLWEASPKQINLTRTAGLLLAGDFRQAFYGDPDHTAQYAYRLDAGFRQRFGPSSLRLDYHLLEPKGYSPFRFDYVAPYRLVTGNLDLRAGRAKAALLSGFDVENSRWQDILVRGEFGAGARLKFGLATAYDPNEGEWRDAVVQSRWGKGGEFLGFSARYDLRRHRLRRLSADTDLKAGPWRLRYLAGYDNFQRKFIYNEVMLARDLHCWEAILFYSQQRKLVRLDLRIKAFEWGGRDFGVGRFGQRIDTSLPDIY